MIEKITHKVAYYYVRRHISASKLVLCKKNVIFYSTCNSNKISALKKDINKISSVSSCFFACDYVSIEKKVLPLQNNKSAKK